MSTTDRRFSGWQRFQIWVMQYAGYLLVAAIGMTLRWQTRGESHLHELRRQPRRAVLVFWHNRILMGTWYWRRQGVVVMTSQNFDGEYIARIIAMHGYGVARGSSSRGGLPALAQMAERLEAGHDVAFSVDGPRGPRYEAKLGPVLLAKRTGCPILCFHMSTSRYVELNSWDRFQIPIPFSRALITYGAPIWVPADADKAQQRLKHQEMQQTMDRLRLQGDSFWKR